jgi:hypothetical protein
VANCAAVFLNLLGFGGIFAPRLSLRHRWYSC